MKYWLVKSEPGAYSWDTFVKDKKTNWDGVRNYQARNNLKAMKKGDLVLFYHSVKDKKVVGIARVTKEYFPDPTADKGDWVAVELEPVKQLKDPVDLEQIKSTDELKNIPLIKQSRLSVMPLTKDEFFKILEMANTQL
ncbi:MAG: ubiquinol-cytochrome c reductase [Vicingaceae bacterium]|jgi:predicted RNA-binding protein with PUA-like domain|nr:MAG: ubiquinol-cytochrome c reductase [Vicingaceae bacterium]